ncbi:MAG TPA: DNA repair protein RadC [Anaerolineae bacterium]|nr:DNA repair protein RadC [Anaerolineae bacterium]
MDDEPIDYHPTIKDLPSGERPRERLAREGAGSLSNAELLAILFRVGVDGENVLELATRLLARYQGLAGLARASFVELQNEHGLGEAKVSALKAALELGRRLTIASPDDRLQIHSPQDAANLLMSEMSMLEQEHLRVMLLDTRNRVLSTPTIYKGNLNTSVVRVSEIFRDAIRQNAAAIIVAHNHPSGDPTPSPEDVAVTRNIISAGKLLDIEVLDHLVIGQQRYVSLKERGLAFE